MRLRTIPIVTVAGVFVLQALPGLGAFADESGGGKTINDGVYTETRAEAGEALYEQHCLTCHDKKYFRPVLKTWSGQPLGILYTMMSASMPQSNPGSLPRKEYVDILAYILSLNRYPAGDNELTYEDGTLDEIAIVGR
jgi:mono/diheme cytochrome c family protein